MSTYYVVFVGRKHGVCDSWFECQRKVIFYKSGLDKAYKSRDKAIRVWVLYQLRWKRTKGAATSSSLSTKYGHEDNHYMQDIAIALLICFVITSLTTLMYLIVIGKLL